MDTVTRQDLLAEARKLPLDDRAELAAEILKTLDEVSEDPKASALWNRGRSIGRSRRGSRATASRPSRGEEVLETCRVRRTLFLPRGSRSRGGAGLQRRAGLTHYDRGLIWPTPSKTDFHRRRSTSIRARLRGLTRSSPRRSP